MLAEISAPGTASRPDLLQCSVLILLAKPRLAHNPDAVVIQVKLVPDKAVAGRNGVRMVIVVPAFAASKESDPPVVARSHRVVTKRRDPHIWVAELTNQVACRPTASRAGRCPT